MTKTRRRKPVYLYRIWFREGAITEVAATSQKAAVTEANAGFARVFPHAKRRTVKAIRCQGRLY